MSWFWLLILGMVGFFLFSAIANAQKPTQPVADRRFRTGYRNNAPRARMTPEQTILYKTHTNISYFFAAIAVIALIPTCSSTLKKKSTPDEPKPSYQPQIGFEGNHTPASIDNTENQNTVSAEEGMDGFNPDFEEAVQQQPTDIEQPMPTFEANNKQQPTDVEQPMPTFEANNQRQQSNQVEEPITKSEPQDSPQKSSEDIATENIAAENAALLAKSVEELEQKLKN